MNDSMAQVLMTPGDVPDLFDVLGRPAWQAFAACRGVGTAAFFPTGRGDPCTEARAICAGCEVRTECLAEALRGFEPDRYLGRHGRH